MSKFQYLIILSIFLSSCKKPKDVLLSEKIKTSIINYGSGINSGIVKYIFDYDNAGKLKNITQSNIQNDSVRLLTKYIVEYENDKVIVRDSMLSGKIYYLEHGTNLIDSVITYDEGENLGGNKVLRDLSGNVTKIEPTSSLVSLITYSYIDSFVYDGNNIKSFKITQINNGTTSTARFDINIDNNKPKRTDNDPNILYPLNGTFDKLVINDISIYGLSLGNGYNNAILSVGYIYYNSNLPNGLIHYSYLSNTKNNLSINFSADDFNPIYTSLVNTYYP